MPTLSELLNDAQKDSIKSISLKKWSLKELAVSADNRNNIRKKILFNQQFPNRRRKANRLAKESKAQNLIDKNMASIKKKYRDGWDERIRKAYKYLAAKEIEKAIPFKPGAGIVIILDEGDNCVPNPLRE